MSKPNKEPYFCQHADSFIRNSEIEVSGNFSNPADWYPIKIHINNSNTNWYMDLFSARRLFEALKDELEQAPEPEPEPESESVQEEAPSEG